MRTLPPHCSHTHDVSLCMRPYLAPGGLRGLICFYSPHTQELVDYFFYALLRTQGEDTTDERSTAGVVPVAEVPNIMRALGFYPTEQVNSLGSAYGTRPYIGKRAKQRHLLWNSSMPRVYAACMFTCGQCWCHCTHPSKTYYSRTTAAAVRAGRKPNPPYCTKYYSSFAK